MNLTAVKLCWLLRYERWSIVFIPSLLLHFPHAKKCEYASQWTYQLQSEKMNKDVFTERGAPSPVNRKKCCLTRSTLLSFFSPGQHSAWCFASSMAEDHCTAIVRGTKRTGREEFRVQNEWCSREMGKKRLPMFAMCWGLPRYNFKLSF